MVVAPSRLWLPLFSRRVSGAVLAQGPRTQCYKLAPQPAVPEIRGLNSHRGSHSCDGATTILLSNFSNKRFTTLGNEYFSMVYLYVFSVVTPNAYICIYISIYIYTYIHVYTYICIYIYVYMYICIYIHIYVNIYINIYTHIYIHIYICIHICICIYICIYSYMCLFTVYVGLFSNFQMKSDLLVER